MAKHVKGSPMQMAKMAEGRQASARHQRRAEEAIARKSIPALKKLIRRNKQRQK